MIESNNIEIRMERINLLSEILYDMLQGNPKAQALIEIIIELTTAAH